MQRFAELLTHSTTWLALVTIGLNLAGIYAPLLADNPTATRAIQLTVPGLWVLYLWLKGILPDPQPPAVARRIDEIGDTRSHER